MSTYSSLPQSETDSFEELQTEKQLLDAVPGDLQARRYTLILWSLIFIGVCSVLDLLSLVYLGNKLAATQPLGAIPFDELPFLSSYSHLDEIYKNGDVKATPRDPLKQLPYTLTQVDSTSPEDIQNPYPNQFKSPYGMIPYSERRTVVTPEVSSVAQFFGADYGMENCSMVLTIPPEARSPNMENAFFDIWALDRSRAIDIRKLSWSSKPLRGKLLGTFSAQGPATQQTQPHECSSGTYQHVEISCREGPCDLHIVASGSEEFNGIYMTQYQTI